MGKYTNTTTTAATSTRLSILTPPPPPPPPPHSLYKDSQITESTTDIMAFRCKLCACEYTRSDSLYRHMKTVHSILRDESLSDKYREDFCLHLKKYMEQKGIRGGCDVRLVVEQFMAENPQWRGPAGRQCMEELCWFERERPDLKMLFHQPTQPNIQSVKRIGSGEETEGPVSPTDEW